MKPINLTVILSVFFFCNSCHSTKAIRANNVTTHCALSPNASIFQARLKGETDLDKPTPQLVSDFDLIIIEGRYNVGGMIKVNKDFDEKELVMMNAKIGTKAGIVLTVQIPIKKFEAFLQL